MLLKAESSTEILSLPCFTTPRDLKRASSSSSSLFDNTYNSDVTLALLHSHFIMSMMGRETCFPKFRLQNGAHRATDVYSSDLDKNKGGFR